ncbi:CapA family protein [Alteribacter natronophilus]|uniref:CapA family protein n=1 Tax=Alteribacter natronophilus TaxID=2583810 RepID=UPI00110D2F68|nr:CapA family protein [Alteribacter natronophilus]TMW72226.1 hypothetical protein FGB90_08420 [Alteribacter natronophilus]
MEKEKQDFKERMRAWTMRERKKALPHSIIALAIVLVIILTEPVWNSVDVPENTRPDNVEHRISMVGDMMTGRHVQDAAEQSGEPLSRVFRYTAPYFHESDYVTGNLEVPIMDDTDPDFDDLVDDYELEKLIHLYGPLGTIDALQYAGFDSVNFANNHTIDYGALSFDETMRHMHGTGIEMVGIGHHLGDRTGEIMVEDPMEEDGFEDDGMGEGFEDDDFADGAESEDPTAENDDSNGMEDGDSATGSSQDDRTQDELIEDEDMDASRISYHELEGGPTLAVLGITDVFYPEFSAGQSFGVFTTSPVGEGTSSSGPELLQQRISEANENADIVMVHVHWGDEYQVGHNQEQALLARLMSSAGADIIIGHHSHVLEEVEVIEREMANGEMNSTLVMFGLGNFVFDQGWTRTKESILAQLDILDDGSSQMTFIPMNVIDSTPRETTGILKPYRDWRIFRSLRKNLDRDLWHVEDSRLIVDLDQAGVLDWERTE